jgi:hypothetical protein
MIARRARCRDRQALPLGIRHGGTGVLHEIAQKLVDLKGSHLHPLRVGINFH